MLLEAVAKCQFQAFDLAQVFRSEGEGKGSADCSGQVDQIDEFQSAHNYNRQEYYSTAEFIKQSLWRERRRTGDCLPAQKLVQNARTCIGLETGLFGFAAMAVGLQEWLDWISHLLESVIFLFERCYFLSLELSQKLIVLVFVSPFLRDCNRCSV